MSGHTTDTNKNTERWISWGLLIFASAFTLIEFIPELRFSEIHHSDSMFHLSVLRALDFAATHGRNPLDFWYDASPFGYALFRTYQYLPYLGIYGFYLCTFKMFTLAQSLQITTVILAAAIPISIYYSSRTLGLAPLESGLAAVASVLISERDNFGFGLQNFTYGTTGIITQLWAVVFLAPAVACCYQYLMEGKKLGLAVAGIFLTFGCHVVVAFVLIFFCGVTFFHGTLTRIEGILKRGITLATLGALVTLHQWFFVLKDAPYINQSNIEPAWKYAGLGWNWVSETLWHGDLFDNNRFPSLMILFLIGVSVCLCQWSMTQTEEKSRHLRWTLLINFCLMLSLMIGWEVWGAILRDTPILRSLHLHRFIVGAHFFGILIIGIGAGAIIRTCSFRNSLLVLSIYFLIILLRPPVIERMNMYAQAHDWRREAGTWKETDRNFEALLKKIETLPRAWVYSGAKQSWQDEILQVGYLAPHYVILARGLNSLGGMLYHAFSLAGDTMFEFNPSRKALYELFGIGSVIAPQSWNGIDLLTKFDNFGSLTLWTRKPNRLLLGEKVFSVCGDLKNAGGFMQRWTSSDNVERKKFGEISSGGCIEGTSSDTQKNFLEAPPTATKEPVADTEKTLGRVTLEEPWLPWNIEGDVSLLKNALVIAGTGFHPNWSAQVDGIPAQPIWVTPGFLAVELPSGQHHVKFEYQGSVLKIFLFFFAIFLMCFVAMSQGKFAK